MPAKLPPLQTPGAARAVAALRPGVAYYVEFYQQGGNYRWTLKAFVGKFLGHHDDGHIARLDWSLRPAAGTTAIDPRRVMFAREARVGEAPGVCRVLARPADPRPEPLPDAGAALLAALRAAVKLAEAGKPASAVDAAERAIGAYDDATQKAASC